jgi:hypothetical protein
LLASARPALIPPTCFLCQSTRVRSTADAGPQRTFTSCNVSADGRASGDNQDGTGDGSALGKRSEVEMAAAMASGPCLGPMWPQVPRAGMLLFNLTIRNLWISRLWVQALPGRSVSTSATLATRRFRLTAPVSLTSRSSPAMAKSGWPPDGQA